jgi:hypothetical protein
VTQYVGEVYSWALDTGETLFTTDASLGAAGSSDYILHHYGSIYFGESGFYTFYLAADNTARFSVSCRPNATTAALSVEPGPQSTRTQTTTVFIQVLECPC